MTATEKAQLLNTVGRIMQEHTNACWFGGSFEWHIRLTGLTIDAEHYGAEEKDFFDRHVRMVSDAYRKSENALLIIAKTLNIQTHFSAAELNPYSSRLHDRYPEPRRRYDSLEKLATLIRESLG